MKLNENTRKTIWCVEEGILLSWTLNQHSPRGRCSWKEKCGAFQSARQDDPLLLTSYSVSISVEQSNSSFPTPTLTSPFLLSLFVTFFWVVVELSLPCVIHITFVCHIIQDQPDWEWPEKKCVRSTLIFFALPPPWLLLLRDIPLLKILLGSLVLSPLPSAFHASFA